MPLDISHIDIANSLPHDRITANTATMFPDELNNVTRPWLGARTKIKQNKTSTKTQIRH